MTCTAAELRSSPGTGAAGRGVAAVGSTWLRRGAVVAVLAVAVVAGMGRSRDLAAAGHSLLHARWGFIVAALGLEAVSMVVFARIQQHLLRAGSVDVGLGSMTAITLAANALALTLP
ncbi:MAG TPA: hypothetical protein VG476_11230, partial [Acidimicrobiales bacterium]|nr:hypothetical protein [Acidimicrobiales bacterium]